MFQPGQLVVCVDADYSHGDLVHRRIYTIAWCGHEPVAGGGPYAGANPCVRLVEVPKRSVRPLDFPFAAARFRPLADSRLSIFKEMLTKTPSDLEAV